MTLVMKLQELNETVVENVHSTDHSCAEIVDHVANEMKKKVVSYIEEKNSWISFLMNWRKHSSCWSDAMWLEMVDVDNVFLDLVQFKEGTDANSVHNVLRRHLQEAGFSVFSYTACFTKSLM